MRIDGDAGLKSVCFSVYTDAMGSKRAKPIARKRRVLLLCAQPLLGESVEIILAKLKDVELIGPIEVNAQVAERLAEDEPDVVVIADETMEVHDSTPVMALILDRFPDVPVIRVELEKNAVRLYTTRTLPARSADLIRAIRRIPIPVRPDTEGSGA